MQIALLPLSGDFCTWRGSRSPPWSALRTHSRTYINISGAWMKPWIDMWERGMRFLSWARVFSISLVHISLAALCAEWWLLDLVLLPRGLLLYCRRLRENISKLILEEKLLPLLSTHNPVLLAKSLSRECGDFCSTQSTLAIVCHWRFWDITKCGEVFQNNQFLRTNINNA